MKKVSLLIAMIAIVCGNAFAQMSYDFNDGVAGAKIAQTYGMPWTTWTDSPGSAEDGVFGEAGGSMAAHFTYGNDQILYLGDHSTGVYDLEFDAYVPNGKNGYFNVLHHFDGTNADNCIWAMQVYMHETNDGQNSTSAPGHGTVHAGSNGTCDLPCVYDEWMHFRVHVDADNDVAQLWFNVAGDPEVMYAEWQWSMDSFGENQTNRILGAMDFFPPTNASTSEYYIDNLTVTLQSNDEILRFEDFEAYTVGEYLAQQSIAMGQDYWTTWNNHPGTSEDGIIRSMGGSQCVEISGIVDQVFLLGDEENGNYDLEFDILVPNGSNGYFNILHRFAGSNSKWAMQCYLHLTNDGQNSTVAPGQGTVHAGSNGTATLTNLVFDDWMHFRLNVDTDTDVANFYYTAPDADEELVCTWQWSLDSFGANTVGRTMAAMDFFAPMEDGSSQFYLDNFSFKKIGGESAPQLAIDPEVVYENLGEDEVTNVDIVIDNAGNSIGDWAGWLDFGEGGEGTQTAELKYHNGDVANASGIGSNDQAFTREIGVRLPAAAYAGSAMGMRIVSAQFYVNTYKSTDNNYIFRLYGQGLHNQPGELLAETTVTSSATEQWITANFDQYDVFMTGQAMWVTVQMEQAAGEFPLTMDNGEYGEESDGNWLSTSGNSFSHCYSAGDFGGAWLITVNCRGERIPATWAGINKTEGAILGGNSETITLSLNSIGLEDGEYNAVLVVNTNDANLEHVEIPVTLNVDLTAVGETVNQVAAIYPNPATSMVTLKGENLSHVAIYNVAGQLVRVVKLNDVINNINMDVEAGVYFFSIYEKNGNNSVQRVVITK
ncbi:MAG: T9SS type A sorting domain-containing protein [Bacteroidales bacterium]|nr:T9SS type A sorting domain-containing protein [Bacteroidales bacterium]